MIVDIEVRDQAYQFFMQESLELLQTIETGLLTLRADQSTPKIHALMRAAHSIKGSAASLDLESIAKLAHRLEDIFRALYTQTDEIDTALEEGLLQAFDCLRSPLVEQVQTGQHDPVMALRRGEAIFATLESRLAEALQATTALPTAAELGVDIVLVVFSGDVEGGITRLEQVLTHPETAEVVGEIRAQAEVFVGIGELVNLPGFVAVSQTVIAALDCQPHNALNIGFAAIADWRLGQAAVIAGDRTQGGQPSDALLKFTRSSGNQFSEMAEPQLPDLDEWDLTLAALSSPDLPLPAGESLDELVGAVSTSPPFQTEIPLSDELEAILSGATDLIATYQANHQAAETSDIAENLAILLDDEIDPWLGDSTESPDEWLDLALDEQDLQALNVLVQGVISDSDSAIPLDGLFQEEPADPVVSLDDCFPADLADRKLAMPLDELLRSEINPHSMLSLSDEFLPNTADCEPGNPLDNSLLTGILDTESVMPLDDLFQADMAENESVMPLDDLFQADMAENESVMPLDDLFQADRTENESAMPLDDLFQTDRTENASAMPLDDLFQADRTENESVMPLDDLFQADRTENESVMPLDDLFQADMTDDESAMPLDDLFQADMTDDESAMPLDDLFQADRTENESTMPLDDLFQADMAENESVMPLDDLFQADRTDDEEPAIPLEDLFQDAISDPDLEFPSAEPLETHTPALPLETGFQEETPANPSLPIPSASPTLSASSPATPAATPEAPYLSNAVRVDMARLERINNLVGELVTHENSSLLDNQQLQSTLGLMLQRFNRFEQITKALQDWTDLSQSAQAHLPTLQPSTTSLSDLRSHSSMDSAAALLPLNDFDPLQMDSYNHLHSLVQETIEEIAQLGEAMRDMSLLTQHSQQTLRKKQQTLKQVRNDLLWARMLPLGDVLQRFPRMIRDLATRYHKQVTLKLSGATTLVDKGVLEKLYEPLVHLVRNAFDHGIELPAVRQVQGKVAQATIEIRAYHRGNQTYIEIRDDGRGIDLEAIRHRLLESKLVEADQVPTLTPEQLYEYLFTPAFSTASQVSELSGRGMGLETVRSQVKLLKGSISVTSEPGQGTLFTLKLPLTLTIAKLLVFAVNGKLMALPIDTLVAILAVPDSDIQLIQGRQFYRWQDQLVPLYPSSEFRHLYPLVGQSAEAPSAMALPQEGKMPLLLVSGDSEIIALEVEHILQEQELVIKPFGQAIAPPDYLYGCTILGDGALVPVVDGPALVNRWLHADETANAAAIVPPLPAIVHAEVPTILVADDSLTARQTLALTLKKAGYRVLQARDGREALDHLRQESTIQAVFCDVEMPQMNGFEFLNHCRQEFPREALPVIMLTSRSSEKHQRIAQLLGATAYLTKPYLEHEMLKTLKSCLSA
jgi:chemotaxis family two-component system sensor histidine kinase/response regulator PixL